MEERAWEELEGLGRPLSQALRGAFKRRCLQAWYSFRVVQAAGHGDHYETVVRASPKLALDAFEKTLQAQRKGRLLHRHSRASPWRWHGIIMGAFTDALHIHDDLQNGGFHIYGDGPKALFA